MTGRVRDIWASAKNNEIAYWRNWLNSKGGPWPDDYANRMDPELPLQDRIALYLPDAPGGLSIIDVGAGPLTILGKKWMHPLEVVATDALANEYDALLAEADIVPIAKTQYCPTEQLVNRFGCDKFELAYARNTLDHSIDPIKCLAEMISITKPGCAIVTEHSRNEGEVHKYKGLHQWNFDLMNGAFYCWRGEIRIDVGTAFYPYADVAEVSPFGSFVRFVLIKRSAGRVVHDFDKASLSQANKPATVPNLSVFEGLGDNCEFGFVLRYLLNEEGSFFRWTSVPVDAVQRLLMCDFKDVYLFDNLGPSSDTMVCDRSFDIHFHSRMKSVVRDGRRTFVDDVVANRRLFEVERDKVMYLVDKFRKRAKEQCLAFVLKKNAGLTESEVAKTYSVLLDYCKFQPFLLVVESMSKPGVAGQAGDVRRLAANIFLGGVTSLAPYDRADAARYEEWVNILKSPALEQAFKEARANVQ